MKKVRHVVLYPFIWYDDGYYYDSSTDGYGLEDIDELRMLGYRDIAVLDGFDHSYLYKIVLIVLLH